MSDPRHTMWHDGREVAAGTREAMLAAGRLMLRSKPKLEPLSSYQLPVEKQLSEAATITRRQSAEIEELTKQLAVAHNVIDRQDLKAQRLRGLVKQAEWTAHVYGDCGCPFFGADKYTADGEQGEHFYDCPAFTVDGVVK